MDMKKWFQKKSDDNSSDLEQKLSMSKDYKKAKFINQKTNLHFTLSFISTLVDEKIVNNDVLPFLLEQPFSSFENIEKILPISSIEKSKDSSLIEQKLFNGFVMLTINQSRNEYVFIEAKKGFVRSIAPPEVEFNVIGPKESFVESIGINLNLIRTRVPIKELIVEELTVGNLSKTKVAILHIDGITDKENVETVRQRLCDLEFDLVADSSFIVQLISDNNNSPFPQLLDTERPDRVAAILAEGKVAIVVDGSPHVLIAPTTMVEFFSSFEDYFLNWILSSFIRLVRVFAVAFSILITPIYVAALNYHYLLIPKDLLVTLVSSRMLIPFPPILEALFMELTIELLREAGARLPTKVGQTIGIVGGIVIGTASVDAGLTSNVLLILVAMAALASFTTPVYKMGNTIRLLRFPFLIFAEIWGLLGIVYCFCFLITHLLKLTSLGRPFLEPAFPPRVSDMKDSVVRLPFNSLPHRPEFLRTEKTARFSKEKAKKKKDIDE